jgi:hypothetical protein
LVDKVRKELDMPKIIVVSERINGEGVVTLEEQVVPAHLEDEHSAAQLVERLGWAIVDAEQAESTPVRPRRPLPRHFAPPVAEWTRQAGDSLAV